MTALTTTIADFGITGVVISFIFVIKIGKEIRPYVYSEFEIDNP